MQVKEELGLSAQAPPSTGPAAGSRLPDSSKELLRLVAEELLVLAGKAEEAEERAAAAQLELEAARAQSSNTAALAQLEQQLQDQARRADAAEQRVQEAEAAAAAAAEELKRLPELAAQLAARTAEAAELRQQLQQLQKQQQQEQRPKQRAEEGSGARQQLAEQRRARHAAEEEASRLRRQVQQLQDQLREFQDQLEEQQQQAAGQQEAAGAEEAGPSGAGGASSDDDETFSEPAPPAVEAPVVKQQTDGTEVAPDAAAGAAAAPQAAAPQAAAAAGARHAKGTMGPPPQRLGSMKGPSAAPQAPAGGAAPRKRRSSGAAEPPSKQARLQAAGGSVSPGTSALGAASVLRSGLPKAPSTAGTHLSNETGPGSPSINGVGDLLLSLRDVAAAQHTMQGGGSGRRGASRGGAPTAGGGVRSGSVRLKAGETSQQWLNRAAAEYVRAVLGDASFRAIFGNPVPRSTPGYHDVIKRPMDLGTIRDKASRGGYASPDELRGDLQLVVANAREFNPPQHPVHKAADRLMDQLEKPHSFYSKVEELFRAAELEALLAEQAAAAEAELDDLERELAQRVVRGMNVAVYAEDDECGNKYYLLQSVGPVEVLPGDEVDDFGQEFRRGDCVVKGHYFDYWLDARSKWDRQGRPYYLQADKLAYVPASSLLAVDFEMRQRPKPEVSPFNGKQHTVYEVTPQLHRELRTTIKKMAPEAAVPE